MITKTLRRVARRADLRTPGGVRGSGDSTSTRMVGARDEAGAVLILALVFLVAVGGIVGSLATWATNDLNNTAHFTSARSLQYAAGSATQLAIQNIRYTPLLSTGQTLNASPPASCWSGSSSSLSTVEGTTAENMAVWCSTVWSPSSAATRVVTFSTCPVVTGENAVTCAANPFLQAVVTFDDYPSGVISSPTTAQCVVYCGTGMIVNSWAWSPTVPTVTSLGTATGPITGGTSVSITGTGFVSGATTVNFVEESGGTPVSGNVGVSQTIGVLPATHVTFTSSTSITATAPPVIAGTTYYVTVTTPGGTGPSAYGSNDLFTYTLVVPTVTSISSNSGSTAGGTAMTITGTGFVTGAIVNFVEESGGSAVSPTVSLPGTSATVISDTSITAVSPAVIAGTTYFVTVTTASGTSASSSSVVFTYSPLVPVVAGFGLSSPNSGPASGGTSVSITGTGFVIGATVNLVQESGGSAVSPSVILPATGVTVTGATTISFVTPAGTSGATYFVTVTTPTGTSSLGPIFTYS